VSRLFDPPQVAGWIVVIVAAVALVVDLVTAGLIWRLSRTSMNLRAAFLHNVMDALGSVAVIVAGTAILLWDWRLVDPIATLGIAGYILWHSLREVRPVLRILMLGSPGEPATGEVLVALAETPGVEGIHHLHLWEMAEGALSVQAHVVLAPGAGAAPVKAALKAVLRERFGIGHSVLELETEADRCENAPAIGHDGQAA
jgi:cobalt-zinc-cadmium efflux system protein